MGNPNDIRGVAVRSLPVSYLMHVDVISPLSDVSHRTGSPVWRGSVQGRHLLLRMTEGRAGGLFCFCVRADLLGERILTIFTKI